MDTDKLGFDDLTRRAKIMEKQKAKRTPRRVKRVKIHRPGEDATYTDAELISLPPAVLGEDQRKRRRALLRRKQQAELRDRAKKAKPRSLRPRGFADTEEAKYCIHIRPNDEQCKQRKAFGTEHCRWHLTHEEMVNAGLEPAESPGSYTPLIGINTTLTPQQQYRRVLEKSFAYIMNKKLAIFGLRVEGYDPHGDPIIGEVPGGGVKLHGESKDGDIIMTHFEDIRTMSKEFEGMIDRTFGKARQSLTVEGGKQPIKVEPQATPERAQRVAKLLDGLGAIPRDAAPHSGRQRRKPAAPTKAETKDPSE
jgi:hypothetical protein